MSDIRNQKAALRRMMETRRVAASAQNPQAPAALRDHFLKAIKLPPGSVIASYTARGGEIDPTLLIEALRAVGHKIALPVMVSGNKPLVFRSYNPGDPLVRNAFGIPEPEPAAPFADPDVLLVPLLAFDRRGGRLGTGGGYYDRTLPDLRNRKTIFAIGLGFSCQELPEIPAESHDVPLDRIVTELQVF